MVDFTAVITGGSQGIGLETAKQLLALNYRVISISRDDTDFQHENFETKHADLLEVKEIQNLATEIASQYQVTHLINNAGLVWDHPVEEVKLADLMGLTQLHLGSALILVQNFLPAMKQRQFGRILFNSSRAALGAKTRTAYAASKAGMIGMARCWALELAPYGITVNVVAPGPILTDNFWSVVPKGSQQEADLALRIPVGRLGKVEDVASAFVYFSSEQASFVTGQTLFVCGGSSIGSVVI